MVLGHGAGGPPGHADQRRPEGNGGSLPPAGGGPGAARARHPGARVPGQCMKLTPTMRAETRTTPAVGYCAALPKASTPPRRSASQ